MSARQARSLLWSLIAPPRCGVCGRSCEAGAPVCQSCQAKLAAVRPVTTPLPGLDGVWSAAPYEGASRELVAALKFGRLLPLARVAAASIAARAPRELLEGALVPVPPAPLRVRLRGLDPAEEIAAELSRLTGLGIVACLARTQGPRQVGRPRRQRVAEPPRVELRGAPPAVAILVDDVLTTGATVGACARALRDGGASRAVVLTFARSLRRPLGESRRRA
jgi:predicted amidophosphoribosyltransferase